MISNQSPETKAAEKEFNGSFAKMTSLFKGRQSVAGMASANIFEASAFVSSSVPMNYATATLSLAEQLYASYVQMAISIDPVISAEELKGGKQFEKFRSNTTEFLEYVEPELFFEQDSCLAKYTVDNCILEFERVEISDTDSLIINEYCNYEPLDEFSHYFCESVRKPTDYNTAKQNKFGEVDMQAPSEIEKDLSDERLQDLKNKNKYYESDHKINQDNKEADTNLKRAQSGKLDREAINADEELNMKREKHAVDTKIKSPQFIDETKINKLNTMKPLMMTVNLRVMHDKSGVSEPIEYIVGVKVRSRLIDADILPEVTEFPLKEMNKISRYTKWRAGELKLFKDIIFKIKQKKQTAIDSKDPKRKWYRRLYELAHDKTSSNNYKGLIPNGMMLLSQSDIINIKSETGIDLLNPSKAKSFCNEIFLMALFVIDTDAESIKIYIPDLYEDYEVQSLAAVNKQLASLDTAGATTRDMLKLLK